ncbi:hypothetical protein F7725_003942, partial [Dissostichus mawsoni]
PPAPEGQEGEEKQRSVCIKEDREVKEEEDGISASMPFSFFSVSLLTARISSRDMRGFVSVLVGHVDAGLQLLQVQLQLLPGGHGCRALLPLRSLLLLAHLVLPGQVPLVLSLHGLHVDFQAQLSVFCSLQLVLQLLQLRLHLLQLLSVQLSGQSQSSGLLLSGLGFSFVSLLCVTSRDVGDDLPQVVLVHQQVVELLLNASLGFVELLEGGALLLHALVGSLQVSLVSLLRLLRRLQRPCLGLHDRAVFSGLDGLPLHRPAACSHSPPLSLALGELELQLLDRSLGFFLRAQVALPCIRLLVELVEGLPVFLPHLPQLLLVDFSLVVQSPFQMSHLGLTLRPERGNGAPAGRRWSPACPPAPSSAPPAPPPGLGGVSLPWCEPASPDPDPPAAPTAEPPSLGSSSGPGSSEPPPPRS